MSAQGYPNWSLYIRMLREMREHRLTCSVFSINRGCDCGRQR